MTAGFRGRPAQSPRYKRLRPRPGDGPIRGGRLEFTGARYGSAMTESLTAELWNGITGIYVLLAILVWIALRMEPRILTVALFILTVLGMGGSFFLHPTTPLNETLFSQELFIEFLAVIYLVFSALVEERRRGRLALDRDGISVLRTGWSLRKITASNLPFVNGRTRPVCPARSRGCDRHHRRIRLSHDGGRLHIV